jgi:hypothetical protein
MNQQVQQVGARGRCAQVLGLVASVGVLAQAAGAQIALVSDTRRVEAFAAATGANGTQTSGPDAESRQAPAADFNGSALASVARSGAAAGASAVQLSSIEPTEISAQGSISLSRTVNPSAGGVSATSSGLSLVDLSFNLPEGATVFLQSAVSGLGEVVFYSPQGLELFSGSGIFDETLPAGRYRLLVRAESELEDTDAEGGGYSLSLRAAPTPGTFTLASLGLLIALRSRRPR